MYTEGSDSTDNTASGETAIPWEGDGPVTIRWATTLRKILLRPTVFFRAMPNHRLGRPFSFLASILMPAISAHLLLVLYLVQRDVVTIGNIDLRVRPAIATLGLEGALALAVMLFVSLAFLMSFYQAAAGLFARKKIDLLRTIRGTCFGFAPMIVAVVPVVGVFIGIVWSLVLHAIALRELHHLRGITPWVVVAIPVAIVALRVLV